MTMRGLLKNNFYTIAGSLKSAFFMVFLGILANIILAVATGYYDYDSSATLQILVLSNSGIFVGLASTALLLDKTTKWSTFEISLPITRAQIIQARYITFIIYGVLGLVVCCIHFLIFYAITKQLNIENLYITTTFAAMFSLLVPAIAYPLTLKFGEEKAQQMFTIAVGLSVFIFFGGNGLLSVLYPPASSNDSLFRCIILIFSLSLFFISYFLSVKLQMKKEVN